MKVRCSSLNRVIGAQGGKLVISRSEIQSTSSQRKLKIPTKPQPNTKPIESSTTSTTSFPPTVFVSTMSPSSSKQTPSLRLTSRRMDPTVAQATSELSTRSLLRWSKVNFSQYLDIMVQENQLLSILLQVC